MKSYYSATLLDLSDNNRLEDDEILEESTYLYGEEEKISGRDNRMYLKFICFSTSNMSILVKTLQDMWTKTKFSTDILDEMRKSILKIEDNTEVLAICSYRLVKLFNRLASHDELKKVLPTTRVWYLHKPFKFLRANMHLPSELPKV
jgi:hypothetical protein